MEKSRRRIRIPADISIDFVFVFIVVVLHLGLAIYYKETRGLDILASPVNRDWNWWWQTIPTDLLRSDLWRSIWFMHFQPPIFNLYGALFFYLIPSAPMVGMHLSNILLGSLISGEIYFILLKLTKRRLLSFAISVILALDAGLFLFEAYTLYDILTLFLLITSVLLFTLYVDTKRIEYAYFYFLSLCILVLTRSLYHILILPVGIAFVIIYRPGNYKKFLLVGVLLSVLPFIWYAKNLFIFGFFGASSWQGFSLWKVASEGYLPSELETLKAQNIINPVVAEVDVFSRASKYTPYGFNLTSEIPLLNRDDQRNINMVLIGRAYQQSAVELIKKSPLRYLKSVYLSYRIFNFPSTLFKHHVQNIQKIPLHVWLDTNVIEGQFLETRFNLPVGSFYFFLIPLCPLIFGLDAFYNYFSRRKNFVSSFRTYPVDTWIIFLLVYTTIIGIFFEFGENIRFRFYIEALTIVYLTTIASRYLPLLCERMSGLVKTLKS